MAGLRAVIIRGPMGSGKTRTGRELLRLLGTPGDPLLLDRGWSPDDPPSISRWEPGPSRYHDLSSFPGEVLVAELAWGDPLGDPRPGATSAPEEWANVLRAAGRTIHLFRLRPEREVGAQRAGEREESYHQQRGIVDAAELARLRAGAEHQSRTMWDMYEQWARFRDLPEKAGLEETTLETTLRSAEEVAREILSRIS